MKSNHRLTPEMLTLFETLPDLYLILSPTLIILTASHAYLEATLTKREKIVGKYIFEVFPDNPDAPEAKGVTNLQASFREVLSSRKAHQMAIQHYDVPHPTQPASFVERYWAPLNTPVLDEEGEVSYIIHKVVNVTELVMAQQKVEQGERRIEGLTEQLLALNSELVKARAQADLERRKLHNILMQAPAMICIFEEPSHIFMLVNPSYQRLVGERPLLSKPIREAMPELDGQPIFELLDRVYRTGESFYANEMKVQLDHDNSGNLGENYYNFIYQALHNLDGEIEGILVFAYQVTAQVEARQQVEQSKHALQEINSELEAANEEINAANEELRASSEEVQTANDELLNTQKQLLELNVKLETHVADRTRDLQAALHENEQHQKQLLTKHDLLQTILGQVPASIATLSGPEHRYSFFNAHYQAHSGERAKVGLTVAEVFPEVIEQGFITILDGVYATGQSFSGIETPVRLYKTSTGKVELHFVDFIYQPLFNEEGQSQGILVFIVDVTEKVEARQQTEVMQQELLAAAERQSKERETLYQVFEQTPAAICIRRGPAHQYTYVNPAYQALFPDRPLLSHSLAEVVPETVSQGYLSLLNRVYETGETFFGNELPFILTYPDGRPSHERYFNFTYQPYRENGEIVGISTFAYDVTEQVLSRREADLQRERLHTLFMEAPAPIVILEGTDLVFQLVNPAYQHIFPGRELLGKPLLEALPELKGTDIVDILRRVYQTGETFVAAEMPLMLSRHEGRPLEEIYWTFTYQARHDREGQVDGIMVFAYEVTHQIKARKVVIDSERQAQAMAEKLAAANQELAAANEEIKASNEELAQSNRQLLRTNIDLDNFIYTASHDLKAPISNIEGLMHTLLRTLPAESLQSERIRRITTLIGESIERFKRTITSLTEVVKLQKENNGEAVSVDLSEVIREVRLDLAPQLEVAQAQLAIDVAACPSVYFSEKNLRSVIYNLLSNALKYRSPDRVPVLSIHCASIKEYAVLTIVDNGLGIENGRIGQLFTMFKRFHDHVEGLGIGLYMIKKMVENAGGKIEVESRLGIGSTFRVYFPRHIE
ncbi:PAS domain-containing protein [Rhodocytophaga rosea]|uniref:histidine kinase n=1 Tax=Rhodocytophaga rosea TaxID=2704465 RepID=A0A6C0GBI5_9BACT|nr:PAS domain-containing protein [Rhodocytophaga rosea]QHT65305.1 PAS domain-containing protein [Rhodocytophaga rosea]